MLAMAKFSHEIQSDKTPLPKCMEIISSDGRMALRGKISHFEASPAVTTALR
jgi:hypothetical protein